LTAAVTDPAKTTITQPVAVPGLGASTATFVLPEAAATPTAEPAPDLHPETASRDAVPD